MDDPGSVTEQQPHLRSHARLARVALLIFAAALLSLFAATRSPSRPPAPSSPASALSPAPAASLAAAFAPAPSPSHTLSHAPALAALARPDLPATGDDLRHPLTAEHARLYRDVDLLDVAWQSLKARDFAAARATLAQHRAEYPSAHDDLNEGLTLLADCMEHPNPQTRASAQRFYDEQTHSMARRRIRRECLEVVPPRSAGAVPLLEGVR